MKYHINSIFLIAGFSSLATVVYPDCGQLAFFTDGNCYKDCKAINNALAIEDEQPKMAAITHQLSLERPAMDVITTPFPPSKFPPTTSNTTFTSEEQDKTNATIPANLNEPTEGAPWWRRIWEWLYYNLPAVGISQPENNRNSLYPTTTEGTNGLVPPQQSESTIMPDAQEQDGNFHRSEQNGIKALEPPFEHSFTETLSQKPTEEVTFSETSVITLPFSDQSSINVIPSARITAAAIKLREAFDKIPTWAKDAITVALVEIVNSEEFAQSDDLVSLDDFVDFVFLQAKLKDIWVFGPTLRDVLAEVVDSYDEEKSVVPWHSIRVALEELMDAYAK